MKTQEIKNYLRKAGLRPTRQRLALAQLLFDGSDKHISAESLFEAARKQDIPVSLATVYNTLHRFRLAGFLREIVIESNRSYFDTNIGDHHHFFDTTTGNVWDVADQNLKLAEHPAPPPGREIDRIDIIVRLKPVKA